MRWKSRWISSAEGLVTFCVPSQDRKSTRLNSSHDQISYAVFCLKKKKHKVRMRSLAVTHDVLSRRPQHPLGTRLGDDRHAHLVAVDVSSNNAPHGICVHMYRWYL